MRLTKVSTIDSFSTYSAPWKPEICNSRWKAKSFSFSLSLESILCNTWNIYRSKISIKKLINTGQINWKINYIETKKTIKTINKTDCLHKCSCAEREKRWSSNCFHSAILSDDYLTLGWKRRSRRSRMRSRWTFVSKRGWRFRAANCFCYRRSRLGQSEINTENCKVYTQGVPKLSSNNKYLWWRTKTLRHSEIKINSILKSKNNFSKKKKTHLYVQFYDIKN